MASSIPRNAIPVAAAMAALLLASTVLAAPGGVPGKPGGGGTEGAGNNLSYPVIFSDNVQPDDFLVVPTWTYATIASTSACISEVGVPAGTAVPDNVLCYYARQRDADGNFIDGTLRVWWLQERAANRWQVFNTGDPNPYNPSTLAGTRVDVSAVDVGDLLESSPNVNTRNIRTEFTLLQNANSDTDFTPFIASAWGGACTLAAQPSNCFAAMNMSGAVPGTDQSINEIQGSDYGPGPAPGLLTGTRAVVDPTGKTGGYHATVYSRCARLVIQRHLTGTPTTWDINNGYWADAGAPVVNIAAYTGAYKAEINAGGNLIYGFNWNAKSAATGKYRITFVIDQSKCTAQLANTEFDNTLLINVGAGNPSTLITGAALAPPGSSQSYGGAVYVDVNLVAKGKGGGGGGGGPGGPGGPN